MNCNASCWNNAVAERFFGMLKNGEITALWKKVGYIRRVREPDLQSPQSDPTTVVFLIMRETA